MKAVEIHEPGGPDALRLCERPLPEPGPGEIRIKVAAAGLNGPDLLQRQGLYPPPEGASDLPGLEVAGVVDAVGDGARLEPGARVTALIPGGGYAEYAIADARHTLTILEDMSFAAAAALPETLFTVWANVFEAGGLTAGETLFVHGATSGIGTMAIAMARAFGATVYGTAGTAEKCARAEALGAEKCFNYKDEDWSAAMQAAGGADVVLDMVGGDYVPRNLALLRPGGRHVSIAFKAGMKAEINIVQLMRNQLVLTGSMLRSRPAAEKARLRDAIEATVWPKVAAGAIVPVLDRTFPLAEAADAHRYLESGLHMGKVVLTL
jgi:putative PIG3 family NAD(P)H quinone oxidoreductase